MELSAEEREQLQHLEEELWRQKHDSIAPTWNE
jgi:hypothetical protein